MLDVRAKFPGSTLADLYDPLAMPTTLLQSHQALDRTVDAAYGKTKFAKDGERVAFLFGLYQQMVVPLEAAAAAKKAATRKRVNKVTA